MTINLIPPKLKQEKRLEKIFDLIFASLFILLIISLIVSGTFYTANKFAEKDIKNIQSKIDDQKNILKKYEATGKKVDLINKKLETISAINDNKVPWDKVMNELAKDTPTQIQIKTLAASEQGNKISITGKASSRREIANFKDKLENSPVFQNVVFSSSSLDENTDDYSFSLNCELEGI